MADRVGVAVRSQRNYESGDRSPDAEYLAALVGLGVDVLYLLTGDGAATSSAPDPAELALLDSYRRCTPEAKVNLIQNAALLSAGIGVADLVHKGGGQHVVGDNAIQIGSVTGKARIKNR